jgi:hypothetical protein
MLIRNVIIVSFLFFLLACKGNKNAAGGPQPEQVKVETVTDSISRLIVSFISIGGGIDRNAKNEFAELIEQFGNRYDTKLNPEIIKWGREGETDFCLKLKELSKDQQEQFIKESKTLLENRKLVRIYENEKCRN